MNEQLNDLVNLSKLIDFERRSFKNSAEQLYAILESKKYSSDYGCAKEIYEIAMSKLDKIYMEHIELLTYFYDNLMARLSFNKHQILSNMKDKVQ